MNDDLDRDCRQPCGRVRPLLHETMDRELTSRERGEVDAHLASCVDCAEFAAGLETVRTTLASLPATPFPDDALQQVFARTIDAEPWWRAWLPSTGWRVALAGAGALALAGAALWTAWNGAALRLDPGSEVAVGDPLPRVRWRTRSSFGERSRRRGSRSRSPPARSGAPDAPRSRTSCRARSLPRCTGFR